MSASKAFQGRNRNIPSSALEQLDRIQQQYAASGVDVLNAWEVLSLSNPDWAAAGWPKDEASLGALRKQLEVNIARKKKSREVAPVSTVKTMFNAATPPPQKKRTTNEISPPTEAKRQLSMDQVSTIPVYLAPEFPTREFTVDHAPTELKPANEWTEKWMSTDNGSRNDEEFRYMNATLETIAETLRSSLVSFGEEALTQKVLKTPASKATAPPEEKTEAEPHDEFASDFDKVGAAAQSRNVLVCGRIVCEAESGKLNAKSTLLEGANGIRVKLDLDSYRGRFSLFPGQHVIVEGASTGSTKVKVEKVFDGSVAPTPSLAESKDIRVWVASGPYTGSEDLKFEYLDALLAQVSRSNPDTLILLGPFVDANHPSIASGRPSIQTLNDKGVMEVVPDLGFEDVLCFFLQRIVSGLLKSKTKVCLIPCTDDVTHSVVAFPQPSLELPDDFARNPRFISLPNPATFNIGNVIFGAANIDALFDFQDEGCAVQGFEPKENMARLTSHLLLQRSYYPIVPPSPDSCVDASARDSFALPPVDVLFVPSRLQPFAQEINGVLCVNPGRSATMKTKMTVARLEIRASTEDSAGPDGILHGSNVAKSRSKVEFFAVG